jgi:hypothetical protein
MTTPRSMLYRAGLVLVGMAFTGFPVVHAQAKWNVGIGAAIPIGTSADQLNPGYNAMLSYALHTPRMSRNHFRLEIAVNSLPERAVPDQRREILSGTANLVLVGESHEAPTGYVIIGAGTYQKSRSVPRHSDAGVNVGAGIRFSMGFFGTFIEARLHYINDDARTKYFPMTFGLTF